MQVPQPKLMMLLAAKWREFQAAGAEAPEAEEEAEEEDEEEEVKFRKMKNWYFVFKIVLTYCENYCFMDREKGQEFTKFLRSLKQPIRTVKGQYNF